MRSAGRRAEDQVIHGQAVVVRGGQGLDEAVGGGELPNGLTAHAAHLVLQMGILEAAEKQPDHPLFGRILDVYRALSVAAKA